MTISKEERLAKVHYEVITEFTAHAELARLEEPERIAAASVLLRGMTIDAAADQAGIKQVAVVDALAKCRQAECLARTVAKPQFEAITHLTTQIIDPEFAAKNPEARELAEHVRKTFKWLASITPTSKR